MPKSARNQKVDLTKTGKKGKELKLRIAKELREALNEYEYVWVMDVQNMRNSFLKEIRQEWQDSRIIFGRTKLMQKVLEDPAGAKEAGVEIDDENPLVNLHELSDIVTGDVGLLFTNESPETVRDFFDAFVRADFARAGQVSPITFTVDEGIVYSTGGQQPIEDDLPLPHSLEATVRSLGMPTSLVGGKVMLSQPYTICEQGDILDSKQTRLLKQFGVACAEFKVHLKGFYSKKTKKAVIL